MVPLTQARQEELMRFPRASGDGPLLPVQAQHELMFPPRERGWSPM